MLYKLTLVSAFLMVSVCSTAQYKFKIITDNNQIYRDELPNAGKLLSDGVWSIPGNSGGNRGWNIPINEWQAGYNAMGPGFLVTEDYWLNYPNKNYDLT
ncbi:MAG: hypothetical protein MI922_06250, partial [Bacteroidales bacterium]|nr:hypothetical protein [Bacteroidales bacterium]